MKKAVILLIIFCLFASSCHREEENSISKVPDQESVSFYGNSLGNLINGGYIIERSGYVYYSNISNSLGLYKMNLANREITKIFDCEIASSINIFDDWIYFIKISEQIGYEGIFKIKTDGTDLVQISKKDIRFICLFKNQIYYTQLQSKDTYELRKMNVDGSGDALIAKACDKNFVIFENWIYFKKLDEDLNVCRVRTDGSDFTSFFFIESQLINVDHNGIYFMGSKNNYSEGLTIVSTDGINKTQLLSDYLQSVFVDKNNIFFSVSKSNSKEKLKSGIYKMDLNGSNKELLISNEIFTVEYEPDINGIQVFENWSYFSVERGAFDYNCYRIRNNGTGLELIT